MTQELDSFERIMEARMIIPMNKEECIRCGSIGTNLNTKFCLRCIGEREREREIVGIMSTNQDIYLNSEILNQYLSELRYILS
jgi:hypothetical protein